MIIQWALFFTAAADGVKNRLMIKCLPHLVGARFCISSLAFLLALVGPHLFTAAEFLVGPSLSSHSLCLCGNKDLCLSHAHFAVSVQSHSFCLLVLISCLFGCFRSYCCTVFKNKVNASIRKSVQILSFVPEIISSAGHCTTNQELQNRKNSLIQMMR